MVVTTRARMISNNRSNKINNKSFKFNKNPFTSRSMWSCSCPCCPRRFASRVSRSRPWNVCSSCPRSSSSLALIASTRMPRRSSRACLAGQLMTTSDSWCPVAQQLTSTRAKVASMSHAAWLISRSSSTIVSPYVIRSIWGSSTANRWVWSLLIIYLNLEISGLKYIWFYFEIKITLKLI